MLCKNDKICEEFFNQSKETSCKFHADMKEQWTRDYAQYLLCTHAETFNVQLAAGVYYNLCGDLYGAYYNNFYYNVIEEFVVNNRKAVDLLHCPRFWKKQCNTYLEESAFCDTCKFEVNKKTCC